MLRLIEADLAEAGIARLSLTGQTQKRAEVLEAFARGDAPVFLLSLKAGGIGLLAVTHKSCGELIHPPGLVLPEK